MLGAATVPDANLTRQREVVDAFLAASRAASTRYSRPSTQTLCSEPTARPSGDGSIEGRPRAAAVAESFSRRARAAQPALVNGAVGLVWATRGRPPVVFGVPVTHGKIAEIELVADLERLRRLDLAILDD
jgi:hypothetical protein